MNPPYSQGGELSEMNFIKHLLDSLGENGKCAVIVPQSVMVGTSDDDKKLKKQILKEENLESLKIYTLEAEITSKLDNVLIANEINNLINNLEAKNISPKNHPVNPTKADELTIKTKDVNIIFLIL